MARVETKSKVATGFAQGTMEQVPEVILSVLDANHALNDLNRDEIAPRWGTEGGVITYRSMFDGGIAGSVEVSRRISCDRAPWPGVVHVTVESATTSRGWRQGQVAKNALRSADAWVAKLLGVVASALAASRVSVDGRVMETVPVDIVSVDSTITLINLDLSASVVSIRVTPKSTM